MNKNNVGKIKLSPYMYFLKNRFFRSKINIFTIAIPQLIFLTSIFVYLCVQIFFKWIFYFVEPTNILGYYYPGKLILS